MTAAEDTLRALEAAKARIAERTAHARDAASDAARMADDVRTLTRTAHSPRREVAATARAGGAVTDVSISASAFDLTPVALSRLVTATVGAAQRAAADAAVAVVAETVGAGSPLVAELRSRAEAQFDHSMDLDGR